MKRWLFATLCGLLLLVVGATVAGFAPFARALGRTDAPGVPGGASRSYGGDLALVDCGEGPRLVHQDRWLQECPRVATVYVQLTETRYGSPHTWKTVWALKVQSVSNPDLTEDEVVRVLTRDFPDYVDRNLDDFRPLLNSGRAQLVQIDEAAAYRNGVDRIWGWMIAMAALLAGLLVVLVTIHGLGGDRGLKRIKRGQCPHCAYDMTRVRSPICPECGHARE